MGNCEQTLGGSTETAPRESTPMVNCDDTAHKSPHPSCLHEFGYVSQNLTFLSVGMISNVLSSSPPRSPLLSLNSLDNLEKSHLKELQLKSLLWEFNSLNFYKASTAVCIKSC